jgi:hypothetical protein
MGNAKTPWSPRKRQGFMDGLKIGWLPGLLFLALSGCGTAPDPAPAAGQAPADRKVEARPVEGSDVLDKHQQSADVVFEGVLKSTAMARVDRDVRKGVVVYGPPGLVIAAVDPRFLIEVEVRKVRKGDEKEWSGTRFIAIHSLVLDFHGEKTETGKPFVFHLWRSEGDAKRFVMLEALPLP